MAEHYFEGPGVPLFVDAPLNAGPATRVLVAVHGISRNAREHLESFRDAGPENLAIVVPHFLECRFPGYQRLGLVRDEPRADLALLAALDALASRTGLLTGQVDLFGFSGGAQFAHRFAMLHPQRVRQLHLASAGNYTYFDTAETWPRGLRRCAVKAQAIAMQRFFLRLPIFVFVGDRDLTRDPGLRMGQRIDAQQGLNRVARAEAWTRHIAALQTSAGFSTVRLQFLPDCGHDYQDAVRIAGLPSRILRQSASLAPHLIRKERLDAPLH